jgi:hypothetical protein
MIYGVISGGAYIQAFITFAGEGIPGIPGEAYVVRIVEAGRDAQDVVGGAVHAVIGALVDALVAGLIDCTEQAV